ncbi:acyltransferase domain-containing protein, partial [Nocardia sp. NPDC050697]|uniref:acyltransferase domain-containing protein n=1 Tax=Nocardia sp. NPDC050697 TaxID=3155158 RepID=UPI0033DB2850
MFVFPGQGAQWLGMGRELMATSPVFAQMMGECAQAFAPLVDWSLLDVIDGEVRDDVLNRVDVVQPALFAVMVSLAQWWRSVGVEPEAVIGHSQGEIAAAYVAGALTLHDAARVVILRAQALTAVAGHGGMASVALPAEIVRERLAGRGDLAVAAINGPTATVVSGVGEALEGFVSDLEAEGVRVRRIPVDYGSHSSQVDALQESILEVLDGITAVSAPLEFYSTVTGAVLDTTVLDAGYWFRNLRETVEFDQAVRALIDAGHTVFVEVSPHPLLALAIEESAETATTEPVVVSSLRRGEGGLDRLLAAAARLETCGAAAVAWPVVFAGRARRVGLPTYAFQHRRYWLEAGSGSGDVT